MQRPVILPAGSQIGVRYHPLRGTPGDVWRGPGMYGRDVALRSQESKTTLGVFSDLASNRCPVPISLHLLPCSPAPLPLRSRLSALESRH
jgi:hypothetical protein